MSHSVPANLPPPPFAAPEHLQSARDNITDYYRLHMLGALFPLSAGMLLYGWRALATIAITMGAVALAVLIWRRIGSRGPTIHWPHALWLGMLLSLMLPPHLLPGPRPPLGSYSMPWTLLPAAAILLVVLLWIMHGTGSYRVHPLLVTILLLAACYHYTLVPQLVLHHLRSPLGDIMDFDFNTNPPHEDPWISIPDPPVHDALYLAKPASERLADYTRGHYSPQRVRLSLEAMLQEHMPPMEDLVIGGHPGPIGASSAIAVIIGGLFLMYRGLVDYRIPLVAAIVAFLTFLVLPVPVVLTESGPEWRSLLFGSHLDLATVITFANYELLASPLLLALFFIATNTTICPMRRRARIAYAALIGILTAVAQLYVSCAYGPYIAIVLAALPAPAMDRFFNVKTLV